MQSNADNDSKMNSLPNNYIAKIAFSKDHSRVYAATSIGLACLDRKKNSWTSAFGGGVNCLNRGLFSHCVFVDSHDRIWYGTEDGAFCYHPRDIQHPKHYTTAQGLTDNSITSFIEDNLGRIWIGTTSGLSKINVKEGTITKYYVENGIQSNEFSDGAACATPDRRFIVMAGTGGINIFEASRV